MQLLDEIEREFTRLKSLAEKTVAQLDDEQFFRDAKDGTNSVAVIIKHMAGNLRSRWTEPFTTDGEKPDRNRDGEFELASPDSRQELMRRWELGWALLFAVIAEVRSRVAEYGTGMIEEPLFRIRNEPHSPLQALLRQVGHYAYHVGQIVVLARIMKGDAWETLSIARGKSADFNQKPERFLTK